MYWHQNLQKLIHIQNTQSQNAYALQIEARPWLKAFSVIELELILYPYKGTLGSDNDISIQPYDTYLKDLSANQKTLYAPLLHYGPNIFGLVLGILITVVYGFFSPSEIFGLQSIVAIIGVYLVGKEIWGDLEQIMINISEKWSLRYYPSEYSYALRSETTLDQYAKYGRTKKYAQQLVLAEEVDMVSRSNARDLKLFYKPKALLQNLDPQNPITRLAMVSFSESMMDNFQAGKLLLSAKISFNKNWLWFSLNHEYFQAVDENSWGCLDRAGIWRAKSTFRRTTIMIGRIKFYLNSKIIPGLEWLVISGS